MTKKEIRQKWVAALRSGEYKQGEKVLRSKDDRFCCLGVLCDLAVKEGVLPEPVYVSRESFEPIERYCYDENFYGMLPPSVKHWAGIKTGSGVYGNDFQESSLVSQNDYFHKSFSEIADIIESEPYGLFRSEDDTTGS